MENTYKTIVATATGQFKDRGSRFIGFLYPVSDEEEIKAHLAALKKEYHDATHYCYAYTIGHTGQPQTRLNDDGEPSGSAARPIFGQLQSAGLSDVLAVVVRYFGGTKLGVPGLINAYKTATREAIANATVVEKEILDLAEASLPYDRVNSLLQLLKKKEATVRGMDYADGKSIVRFEIRHDRFAELQESISPISPVSIQHLKTI